MNGITLTRKSIVEAIGTFFLAVFGCGMGALLSVSNASSGLDITHYSIIVALTYDITYIILYYSPSGTDPHEYPQNGSASENSSFAPVIHGQCKIDSPPAQIQAALLPVQAVFSTGRCHTWV